MKNSSIIAVIAMLLIGPVAWGQGINKKSGLGIDLSTLDVPEVPAAVSESVGAPPQTDASEAPADSGIVEESVGSVPKAGNFKMPGRRVAEASPMTLVAEYSADGSGKGQLLVTATMDGNWHTYSTTQPAGGPKPSKITIATPGVKLAGKITSDKEPDIHQVDGSTVLAEEHYQRVVWSVPLEFASDFKPGQSELKVSYDGQVCEETCREVRETLVAKFISTNAQAKQEAFRSKGTHASFTAHIEPAEVKPGSEATLVINVKCDPKYHIYSFVPGDKSPTFKTLIVPTQKGDLKWGQPIATSEPHVDKSQGFDVLWHEGEFQWKIPLQIPSDAAKVRNRSKLP